ncbi:MAG: hypothetical protein OXC30_02005 [Alphaproteobacteria bacterium]|nr:hypothetical protein [Alphaproteobacteria bacterium]
MQENEEYKFKRLLLRQALQQAFQSELRVKEPVFYALKSYSDQNILLFLSCLEAIDRKMLEKKREELYAGTIVESDYLAFQEDDEGMLTVGNLVCLVEDVRADEALVISNSCCDHGDFAPSPQKRKYKLCARASMKMERSLSSYIKESESAHHCRFICKDEIQEFSEQFSKKGSVRVCGYINMIK